MASLLPEALALLTVELGKLPGIGPRSAERLALYLVQSPSDSAARLASAILTAREKIQFCSQCGALTEQPLCGTCANPRRDTALICVVERAVDVLSMEKTTAFSGLYHVLGGKISPINGVGPEDLRIAALEQRIAAGTVQEVILALGSDVEGDATCYYLAKRLGDKGIKTSRLAHGLPVGSSLEFADDMTLSRAFQGRQPVT